MKTLAGLAMLGAAALGAKAEGWDWEDSLSVRYLGRHDEGDRIVTHIPTGKTYTVTCAFSASPLISGCIWIPEGPGIPEGWETLNLQRAYYRIFRSAEGR